jgi:SSS family transporter
MGMIPHGLGMAYPAPLIDGWGMGVLGAYLGALLILGIIGRLARRNNSLGDFFLAGRGLGFLVLLLTLYATQYSGNTLIGFSASGYRNGFSFLVSVAFMMGVVGVYLSFAPQLNRLSKAENYVTLGDYIQGRYRSRLLTVCISISGIIALGNFLITNLKAMGEVATEVTGGAVSPVMCIAVLALVIIIYETLGGLRSVAWTDVLQGLMLFFGCTIIFVAVIATFGGLETMADRLHEVRPDFWQPPGPSELLTWTSTLLIVSIGVALYPQAIQRVYAARNATVLRRALVVMVFLPLFTTLPMVLLGILTNVFHPDLSPGESERATAVILGEVAMAYPAMKWIIVLFVGAVLAAIMSTADSALLSIASSITKDLVQPVRPQWDEAKLTFLGKGLSWGIMAGAALLAITLPQSIWALVEIKVELLVQCAPALILGIHCRKIPAQAVLAGFIAGNVLALAFLVGGSYSEILPARPLGVHAGLWGLLLNIMVIVVWRRKA